MPTAPADGTKPDASKYARKVAARRERDTERDNAQPVIHPPTLQRPPYWIKARAS